MNKEEIIKKMELEGWKFEANTLCKKQLIFEKEEELMVINLDSDTHYIMTRENIYEKM
jgi:hypothetical protein